jgi:hypothetical protein
MGRKKNVWASEIIIRGACGGFLFGIPLLYTMEVWWVGSLAKPPVVKLRDRLDIYRSHRPYEAVSPPWLLAIMAASSWLF